MVETTQRVVYVKPKIYTSMITILDFASGKVHQYYLPDHLVDAQIEEVEEWVEWQGFRLKDIEFLTHDFDSKIIH